MRRAAEANKQPVVAGGAGSGQRTRTGSVGQVSASALRNRLNNAVAKKDPAALESLLSSAREWMKFPNKQDKAEVQNIINTAQRLATRFRGNSK